MTTTDLTTQIAARTAAAIAEAREQLAKGWTDAEVLTVARDAWDTIADLKEQAERAEMREYLIRTACKDDAPWGACWLAGGHPGQHTYTMAPRWAA